MNLFEILGILLVHWFADFVMQTDKQAKGKSKNWSDLISHTRNYSLAWYFVGVSLLILNCYFNWFEYRQWSLLKFVSVTFVAHTITDYFTSRLNSKLYADGKIHNFFVSIGITCTRFVSNIYKPRYASKAHLCNAIIRSVLVHTFIQSHNL